MFSGSPVASPVLDLNCRVLTKEDLNLLKSLERIERLCHRNPWDERSCRECFDETYRTCAAFLADRMVGFAVIYAAMVTTDLLTIGVDPAYQGRGIGRCLLEFTLREALKQKANECFLEVRKSNLRAQHLYTSLGFVRVGERKGYYSAENGMPAEDAYPMVLRDIASALH